MYLHTHTHTQARLSDHITNHFWTCALSTKKKQYSWDNEEQRFNLTKHKCNNYVINTFIPDI